MVSFFLCVGDRTPAVTVGNPPWTGNIHKRRKMLLMKEACQFCHKTFPSGWQLKRHESIHLGVKPFKCRICSKAFLYKDKCHRHEKTHVRHLEAYMIPL